MAISGAAGKATKKSPRPNVPTVELDRCHLYRSDVPDALDDLDVFEQQVHPHFRRSWSVAGSCRISRPTERSYRATRGEKRYWFSNTPDLCA